MVMAAPAVNSRPLNSVLSRRDFDSREYAKICMHVEGNALSRLANTAEPCREKPLIAAALSLPDQLFKLRPCLSWMLE
jgi:hypothetical protein